MIKETLMRRIALVAFAALVLVGITGCSKRPVFFGKCVIEKVDGKVTSVKVVLPSNDNNNEVSTTYKMSDRESMNHLIQGLESLLLDLKIARDQMAVVEPPPSQ
jgi:hypothetical protein